MTWSMVASGTLSSLYALAFADSQIGVVVGDDRAILRTSDGGAAWAIVSGRTTEATALDWRLVEAAERATPEQVQALLRAGASPDATNRIGHQTALTAAAERGDSAIVRILLEAGADVNKGTVVHTALMPAARGGHTEIVRLLLERGACVAGDALVWAAVRGHDEIVRLLLASGADARTRGSHGASVLVDVLIAYPRMATHVPVISALLEAGAPVNERDRNGQTALDVGR